MHVRISLVVSVVPAGWLHVHILRALLRVRDLS